MRAALACLLLLCPRPTRAEEPAAVATRLVEFARAGCDFLRAHSFDRPDQVWPDRRLALHFGRVVRKTPVGATTDYFLAVPSFPSWKVIYESRITTFHMPAETPIRMSDLIKLVGAPKPPDVDAARVVGETTAPAKELEWVFPQSAGQKGCWFRATSDGVTDQVERQRVLTFSFQD